jgi:copper chaperone CopZ
MEESTLVIPHLETENQALDLSNALLGVSGVSRVVVDEAKGTLTVDYDDQYLSESRLKDFIAGAGYPSAGDAGQE